MEIFILLALIFLNGLFVMSEIALVSARKSRLENLANKGDENARKALDLANNPEIFLSAAQIGITLIAILTGVYSGERFGKYLEPSIEKIEAVRPYARTIATTIIVIIVTFLINCFWRTDSQTHRFNKSRKDITHSGVTGIVFLQGHPPLCMAAEQNQ